MHIISMVNVEYLKLLEPSMIDEEEENQVLSTVEYLSPHGLKELNEVTFSYHKEKATTNVKDWFQGTYCKENKVV